MNLVPECDVVGLGENSVDLVYRLPSTPRAGDKVRVIEARVSPGGQVATTICACAALGLRTRYVGIFGSDDNGRRIRDELVQRGVDLSGSLTRDVANRYAVILVDDRTGERTVLWQRDPQLALQPGMLVPDLIAGARLLHVDNVDEEAAIAGARLAHAAGIPVTSDIDAVTTRTPALVAAVTVPIFARHVPEALTGEPDLGRALRLLRQRHDGMLCVTMGTEGAMLLEGNDLFQVPGYPVETVDTTGAGDVFRGAFIYAWLRAYAPDAILRFANAAAAISCTGAGAIGGIPSLAEVEALVRQTA